MAKNNNEDMICSFCGKNQLSVKKMIVSSRGGCYICDECVQVCSEIMMEEAKVKKQQESLGAINLLPPKEIKAKLD